MFTIEKKIQLQYKTLLWGKQDVYGIQWKPKKYIHNRRVPFESNTKENFKKVFLKCWSPSIVLLVGMQNSKDILTVVFKEVNVEGDVKRITDVGWKCGITTLSILITWTSTQPFSQTGHKLDIT